LQLLPPELWHALTEDRLSSGPAFEDVSDGHISAKSLATRRPELIDPLLQMNDDGILLVFLT
jgi:hypothetical protein